MDVLRQGKNGKCMYKRTASRVPKALTQSTPASSGGTPRAGRRARCRPRTRRSQPFRAPGVTPAPFSLLTDRRAGACPPYMPRKSGKVAMGWDCYGHFQSSCNAFFYDKQEHLMLELLANPCFSAFSSNPARGRAGARTRCKKF